MLYGLTRSPETSGVGGRAGGSGPAAKPRHRQLNWVPLLGQVIEIRKHATTIRVGRVDGVTADGMILWLEAHGAEPRTMYEHCEGFTAWIDYKWESGPQKT
jgi:hypothetical protein